MKTACAFLLLLSTAWAQDDYDRQQEINSHFWNRVTSPNQAEYDRLISEAIWKSSRDPRGMARRLEDALKIRPDSPAAPYILAVSNWKAQRWSQCTTALEPLIKKGWFEPNVEWRLRQNEAKDPYFLYADCLAGEEKFAQSHKYYLLAQENQLVASNQTNFRLAEVLLRLGMHRAAISHVPKGHHSSNQAILIELYWKMGNKAAARRIAQWKTGRLRGISGPFPYSPQRKATMLLRDFLSGKHTQVWRQLHQVSPRLPTLEDLRDSLIRQSTLQDEEIQGRLRNGAAPSPTAKKYIHAAYKRAQKCISSPLHSYRVQIYFEEERRPRARPRPRRPRRIGRITAHPPRNVSSSPRPLVRRVRISRDHGTRDEKEERCVTKELESVKLPAALKQSHARGYIRFPLGSLRTRAMSARVAAP